MHEMIEKLTKCAEMELEKGIDKIDAEEMGEVTDMIKDLAEAEYYSKISKAMDEAEYGEDYDYKGAYDEHERKGYRGQRRDSKGRYMSNRGRRGYEIPMMMYDEDWDEMERMRDMDRISYGRMGYSSVGSSMGGSSSSGMNNGSASSQGGNRGYSDGGRGNSESRYDRARRGYEETKSMHKDNSSESKQMKMKSLEDYMKSLAEDVTDMVNDMSPEEKSLMKQKMSVLMQKIQ
jgi:hypothetical protein